MTTSAPVLAALTVVCLNVLLVSDCVPLLAIAATLVVEVAADTAIVPVLVSKYSSVFCGVIVTVILALLFSICVIAVYVLLSTLIDPELLGVIITTLSAVDSIVMAAELLVLAVDCTDDAPLSASVPLVESTTIAYSPVAASIVIAALVAIAETIAVSVLAAIEIAYVLAADVIIL